MNKMKNFKHIILIIFFLLIFFVKKNVFQYIYLSIISKKDDIFTIMNDVNEEVVHWYYLEFYYYKTQFLILPEK